MRTHTTLTLRTLILQEMNIAKRQLSQHEIDVWKQALPEIREEMFKYMDFFIGSIFEKSLVRRQLQQVQSESVYLLNAVDRYTGLSAPLEQLKNEVIACLDSVIERLITQGAKYLDPATLMPCLHLRRESAELKAQNALLQAALTKSGVVKKLTDLILEPITDCCTAKKCSYERLAYLKNLQISLLEMVRRDYNDCNDLLVHHLFEYNFNTKRFVDYMQGKIRAEVEEIDEVGLQLGRLYHYQRDFDFVSLRKQAGCVDASRRRNKEVMLEFIRNEIHYLQNKEKIRIAAEQALVVPMVSFNRASGYRIQTTFSVDALAYFLRLLMDAGLVQAEVKTELFSCIAETFQTPGMSATGISAGSLGTKYKNVVQATAVKVRTALKKMLKQLDQDFAFD